jgi:hypothetical protein
MANGITIRKPQRRRSGAGWDAAATFFVLKSHLTNRAGGSPSVLRNGRGLRLITLGRVAEAEERFGRDGLLGFDGGKMEAFSVR